MVSKRAAVLIIDDEAGLHAALGEFLGDDYDLRSAFSAEEGLEKLRKERFACILLDITLPGMDGLTLFQTLRDRDIRTPVIVLTAMHTVHTAVRAMKLGAEDYITKPWEPDQIRVAVARAVERHVLRDRVEAYEGAAPRPIHFDEIVTCTKTMREVLALARQMSQNDSRVLIIGETGTGKELLARAIHDNGIRCGRPFIPVNCAAIPAELAESELFGHEKGAFTGAVRAKKGQFELAHEGTLFLDEITSLSLEIQAKLLRVIQDGFVHRVGSEAPVRVDVRILAASNRDVQAEAAAGRFRDDLFYRLNVVPIVIPPLRERREDIPLLLDHFLRKYNQRFHKDVARFGDEPKRLLFEHHWPGNVRELEHTVERLVILEQEVEIGVRHLPMDIALGGRRQYPEPAPEADPEADLVPLREAREQFERQYVLNALVRAEWNQTHAAEMLGVNRNTVIAKMQQYGITPPWAEPRPAAK
jgi:DNA-binding NtrC family response regulator